MTNQPNKTSAVEVIRWVYLARELRRRGREEAAELWYAKASQWLRQSVYEPDEMTAGQESEKPVSQSADAGGEVHQINP
jgi:hypothetical protein